MRQVFRVNEILLIICLVLTGLFFVGCAGDREAAPLVLQGLDYTENPVDIPNPDRGFERGNDDAAGLGTFVPGRGSNHWGYMTIPASANTILGQPFKMAYEMTPPLYFGGEGVGPEYCNVPVEPRIVQFYLVLNEFSSNAWCDSSPGNPADHTRVGVDGPITAYGLNFLREQFEFIRSTTNSVAHIRVCYDPKGWNHFVWTADNLKYEDDGPASARERYYYNIKQTTTNQLRLRIVLLTLQNQVQVHGEDLRQYSECVPYPVLQI